MWRVWGGVGVLGGLGVGGGGGGGGGGTVLLYTPALFVLKVKVFFIPSNSLQGETHTTGGI